MRPDYASRCATLIFLAVSALVVPVAHARLPVIRHQQRLPMPPLSAPRPVNPQGSHFGEFAVTDGHTIVVTVDFGPAAYAYVKDATGRWVYENALVVPAGFFASTGAAVRGNVALVQGRSGVNSEPFIFVFVRAGGQWTHTQTLPGPDANGTVIGFGLGRGYLAVGDINANDAVGVVHIYNEAGPGTYVFNTDLTSAAASPGWLIGYHVVVDGDTVMAAAPGNRVAAAFARAAGVWSEQGVLTPNGIFMWLFGLSGNRAVLMGDAEEFVRRNGVWQKGATLVHPSDPRRRVGSPMAIDGRRLLLSEQGSENALLFELQNGTWRATGVVRNANDAACGGTISLVGTLALAACSRIPTPDYDLDGRVLVYELPPLQ